MLSTSNLDHKFSIRPNLSGRQPRNQRGEFNLANTVITQILADSEPQGISYGRRIHRACVTALSRSLTVEGEQIELLVEFFEAFKAFARFLRIAQ